jgi:hypothetical protein
MDHVKTVQYYRTGKKFDISISGVDGEFDATWTCLSCSTKGIPLPLSGTQEGAVYGSQADAGRHECPEES